MQKRSHERGDHFAGLIVVIVVALVGVLGFLGYNAWQKQSSNAGGAETFGSTALEKELKKAQDHLAMVTKVEQDSQAALDRKRANERKEDPAIDKLYNQRKKAEDTLASLPDATTLTNRVATRQAEAQNISSSVVEAQAQIDHGKAQKAAAPKKQKDNWQRYIDDWQGKKQNRIAKLNDALKEVNKAQDKLNERNKAQADYNSYDAKIKQQRDTWPQTATLRAAKYEVEQAKIAVNNIKAKIAAEKNKPTVPATPAQPDVAARPNNLPGETITIKPNQWTTVRGTDTVNDSGHGKVLEIQRSKVSTSKTASAKTEAAKSLLSGKEGKNVETCITARVPSGKKSTIGVSVQATSSSNMTKNFNNTKYETKCVTGYIYQDPARYNTGSIELVGNTLGEKTYVKKVTVKVY